MNAYLVEAKRTAIGRAHPDKGLFREVRADEMLAALMCGMLEELAAVNTLTEAIEDIYIGCVGQHLEQGKNIARLASLLAGLPVSVPGVTINRLCASSLQAFNFAATAIASGQAELLLAGGVEALITQDVTLDTTTLAQPGVFGSAVVAGHTTLFLDLLTLAGRAGLDTEDPGGDRGADAGPGPALDRPVRPRSPHERPSKDAPRSGRGPSQPGPPCPPGSVGADHV